MQQKKEKNKRIRNRIILESTKRKLSAPEKKMNQKKI